MHDDGRVEAFVQSTLRAADQVQKISTQSSACVNAQQPLRSAFSTTNVLVHPAIAADASQSPIVAADDKEPATPNSFGSLQSGERANWRDPGYFGLYYSTFLVGVFSSTGPLMYPIFTQLLQMPSYRVKAVMQVLFYLQHSNSFLITPC
jgi:hypothetical protein